MHWACYFCGKKVFDHLHHGCAVGFGQTIVQRQAGQAVAFLCGVFIHTGKAAVLDARRGAVQRHIMERRCHTVGFQIGNELSALFQVPQLDIEQMPVMHTAFRHGGQLQ